MISNGKCVSTKRTVFLVIFLVIMSSVGLLSCSDSTPQLEFAGRWSYSFPSGLDDLIDFDYDAEGGLIDAYPITNAEIDGKGYLILCFAPASGKYNSRFFIFDTEDPISPRIVSTITPEKQDVIGLRIVSSVVSGEFLLASLAGDKGIWMVDISDPANPIDLGIAPIEVTSNIIVSGNYAYASGQLYNGVTIMDVPDTQDVREVARIDLSTREHCLAVDGECLYIGIKQTMTIFDISNPASPKIISTNELEVPEELVTELPFYTGEIHWGNWVSIIDMQASGDYVYLTFGAGQVRVIDISNPLSPEEVAEIDLGGFATTLTLEDDYLYVMKSDVESQKLQLVIVDISNPESPELLDTVITSSFFGFGGASYAYCFAHPQVIGDYVYVGGVNFFDIFRVKDK